MAIGELRVELQFVGVLRSLARPIRMILKLEGCSTMAANNSDISILLIDDDAFILDLAIRVLSKLGYEKVDTANDGNSALGKLITARPPYDLIICDLNMPEMDGVEFIRHASDYCFTGGLILLSGEDKRILETVTSLARAHKLNVLGSLSKPLLSNDLAKLLNNFEPASKEKSLFVPERSITEAELRNGIRGSSDNQLLLVYQPKVSVKTGEIVGVETLARWWNMNRGVLGPDAFIPLAEELGLISELTNKIYREAVVQAADWEKQGLILRTAINFSVNSFSEPEFCNFIVDIASNHLKNPERIVLEITETQAMTIAVDCLEALMRLRIKRFGVSIDDFGTGNSSLAQLKNIPFTEMKIDRAFVHGAADDPSALAILETSVSLARKLDMEIVAEGAETREDWELVERLGCDYVQGFYCAKPMRNEDFLDFMDNWTGPH